MGLLLQGGPYHGQTIHPPTCSQIHIPGWTPIGGDLCSLRYDGLTGLFLGYGPSTPQPRNRPRLDDVVRVKDDEDDWYWAGYRDGYEAHARHSP